MAAGTAQWPEELRFNKARAELLIRFDDGGEGSIPYELLRVESPSAETKGHGSERPPPPANKRNVSVVGAEPVGRYALRIRFDDLLAIASGATGNPAILAAAQRLAPTDRPSVGYAMIFPSMTVVKILCAQLVLGS